MSTSKINLNHFRIFEAVYRHKSMTKSAKELQMTQSGVSQNIKAMEEYLNFPLFDRIRQRLVPTQQSHLLYQCCQQGLRAIESGLEQLMGEKNQIQGVVKIGMVSAVPMSWAIDALKDIPSLYPLIQCQWVIGESIELIQALNQGSLHLALLDRSDNTGHIETSPLYENEWVLVAHDEFLQKIDHTLIQEKAWEKLPYVDFIVGRTRFWEERADLSTQKKSEISLQVPHYNALISALKAGIGIGPILKADFLRLNQRDFGRWTLLAEATQIELISLAQALNHHQSLATQEVVKVFRQKLAGKGKGEEAEFSPLDFSSFQPYNELTP